MVVAMHQPQYMPRLGYFYKMIKCDKFVILDTVQYPRGRKLFHPRNLVKTSAGTTMLTVPVKKYKGFQRYDEVKIEDNGWRGRHLKTFKFNYSKAAYFKEVYRICEESITNENLTYLWELNFYLINKIREYLNIPAPTIVLLSSLLGKTIISRANELIVDMCKALNADTYLSDKEGSLDYIDVSVLRDGGIELKYCDFIHPEYPQLWGKFIPNLSVLDLLYNCGPNSKEILLGGG